MDSDLYGAHVCVVQEVCQGFDRLGRDYREVERGRERERRRKLTLGADLLGQRGAGDGKVEEVEDPPLEEGVTRAGDGLDEGGAEDRNRCWVSLQRLTQGSEQISLFFRVGWHG